MVCVNAGMGSTISGHLEDNKNDFDAYITNLNANIAKMDIQGPQSGKILYSLLKNPEEVFEKFPYFSFKGDFDLESEKFNTDENYKVTLKNNTPILLSRSGYTGEFGFEIFLKASQAMSLWENLLKAGKTFGITPCGLGARDSLRTGAGLPLSHQDIGNFAFINHPWEFALPYNKGKKGFTKSFIGDQALLGAKPANDRNYGFTQLFVGDSLRKIHPGDSSRVLNETGKDIGWVLSCATDMAIDFLNDKIVSINSPGLPDEFKIKGLSCGLVLVSEKLDAGTKIVMK
jgi:aminomethyltransferase